MTVTGHTIILQFWGFAARASEPRVQESLAHVTNANFVLIEIIQKTEFKVQRCISIVR